MRNFSVKALWMRLASGVDGLIGEQLESAVESFLEAESTRPDAVDEALERLAADVVDLALAE